MDVTAPIYYFTKEAAHVELAVKVVRRLISPTGRGKLHVGINGPAAIPARLLLAVRGREWWIVDGEGLVGELVMA